MGKNLMVNLMVKPQHLVAFDKANQQLMSSSASRHTATLPPSRAAPAAEKQYCSCRGGTGR